VSPVAASDGRFAAIVVLVVALPLVEATWVFIASRLLADSLPTTLPSASVRHPSR